MHIDTNWEAESAYLSVGRTATGHRRRFWSQHTQHIAHITRGSLYLFAALPCARRSYVWCVCVCTVHGWYLKQPFNQYLESTDKKEMGECLFDYVLCLLHYACSPYVTIVYHAPASHHRISLLYYKHACISNACTMYAYQRAYSAGCLRTNMHTTCVLYADDIIL